MAISVDWSTKPYLITIPQSDLTLVEGTKYTITVNFLWQLLREFSDGPEGSAFPITYRRIPSTASTPAITEINDPTYEAQFEDGAYSVDIINGNTNFRDVEVKNTVSVGTNNTTGFIDPQFLELGLFAGVVCIDAQNSTGNAVNGTDKTSTGAIIGTRQAPCLGAADALTIAMTRGINRFNLMSNLNLTGGDYSDGYVWGGDRKQIILNANAASDVTGNAIDGITVQGELDGLNTLTNSTINAVTNVSGSVFQCQLASTLGVTNNIQLDQCFSSVAGTGYPKLTNIGANNVIVRDMRGSIGLSGMTGGTHSIGVYGGRIVIEADCSGGDVYVRGDPYDVTDLSGGAVTVNIQTTPDAVTTQVWAYTGP